MLSLPSTHQYYLSQAFVATTPPSRHERRPHCRCAATATITASATNYNIAVDPAEAVVVILGATGTGKSKLAVDIGTRYPSEVVNTDKMQVYKGLDIATNKMPLQERKGVPHHLIDELDPSQGELTASGFRCLASARIGSIRARDRLPILAGGSNSFVHALVASTYDEAHDPFASDHHYSGLSDLLRYRCCFLWVDVDRRILEEYLDRRVDEMVEMGLVEELMEHYDPNRSGEGRYVGLDKTIGVPEFDSFFDKYASAHKGAGEKLDVAWRKALDEMKRNTRKLARRQVEKIERMRGALGWNIQRLDATEVVRRKVEGKGKDEVEAVWEADVLGLALRTVGRHLGGDLGSLQLFEKLESAVHFL